MPPPKQEIPRNTAPENIPPTPPDAQAGLKNAVETRRLSLVPQKVREIKTTLTTAIDSCFKLDDAVRTDTAYPKNIRDPYRNT